MPSEPKQRNTTEATQGTRAPRLIYVLVAGIALVIVGFFIVYLSTKK